MISCPYCHQFSNCHVRYADGTTEEKAKMSSNNGNKWMKQDILFERVDFEFQVVLEGVVGKPGLSDIAVDDVVFHEGCK